MTFKTTDIINNLKEQLKFHDNELKRNQNILSAFLDSNNAKDWGNGADYNILDMASDSLSKSRTEMNYIQVI
jgi:hypothetical protein